MNLPINEIQEARDLFEKTELIDDPKEKLYAFIDSLDILNYILEINSNADKEITNYILNLRITYSRSLLIQIYQW